jgi:hypothetical protein
MAEPATDNAAIDALVDSFAGGDAPAPAEADTPDAIEAAPEPPAPAPEEKPAPASASSGQAKIADDVDPGTPEFQALARKEKKLREEQAAIKAEREAVEAAKAQLAEYERAKRIAKRSPVEALKALGYDDKQMADAARLIYGETLGDEAPADVKQHRARAVLERETEDLRAQIEELKAQVPKMFEEQRREAARQSYVAQLKSALPSVSEGTRYLKRLAAKDPDAATRAIYALAEKHAAEEGTVPEIRDLASKLESQLVKDLSLFLDEDAPPAAPKQSTKAAGEQKTATLTNRNTVTATKPRRQPQNDDELISDIVAEVKEMASR